MKRVFVSSFLFLALWNITLISFLRLFILYNENYRCAIVDNNLYNASINEKLFKIS